MPESYQRVPNDSSLPASPDELLTQQFYAWERRGRGWQLWDYPVVLEPPFRPFLFHYVPPRPVWDDARKPTFLSALFEKLLGTSSQSPASSECSLSRCEADCVDLDPEPFNCAGHLVELQVALPP